MNTILRSVTVFAGAGVVAVVLAFAVGQLHGPSVSSAAGASHVGVSALSASAQHVSLARAHLASVALHAAPTRAFRRDGPFRFIRAPLGEPICAVKWPRERHGHVSSPVSTLER